MALKKLISNVIDSVEYNITLQEVLDSMIKNKTKHFVLLNNKKPVGIITERDILFLYTKHIDLNLKAIDFAKKCLITSKFNRKVNYILEFFISAIISLLISFNQIFSGALKPNLFFLHTILFGKYLSITFLKIYLVHPSLILYSIFIFNALSNVL